MIRKVFFLFLLPLAGAVTFYACKCNKELGDYMLPVNVWVEPGDNETTGYYHFTGDTLRFNVTLGLQCIADNQPAINPFATTAWATVPQRCPCGQNGFKVPLTGLSITTIGTYNSYADGADVSALFAGYTESYNSQTDLVTYNYFPLSELPVKFSESIYHEDRFTSAKIFLTEKPTDTLSHKFMFTLTTQDTTLSYIGDSFKWM